MIEISAVSARSEMRPTAERTKSAPPDHNCLRETEPFPSESTPPSRLPRRVKVSIESDSMSESSAERSRRAPSDAGRSSRDSAKSKICTPPVFVYGMRLVHTLWVVTTGVTLTHRLSYDSAGGWTNLRVCT